MKILFIAPHLSTGGAPQYLFKKMQLLQNDCDIYCVEYNDITGGLFVVQREQIQNLLGDKLITLDSYKQKLIDIIKEINPYIVHFEEMPEYFCDVDIAKQIYIKNREYKIIETSHDSSFDIENKLFYPDKFVFVSDYQKNRFSSIDVPAEVVEYPIEKKNKTNRKESLIELGLNPDKIHFLNVGLFTPRKNQAEIIEYAKKLTDLPVQFHFVGNQAGNFEDYWTPLMKSFPDNCKWWGERKDIDVFYNAMDVFLFTSKGTANDKETSPLVLKEAIGWGIPVLMRRLDVYCGMHDKYPNVHYIGENLESNLDIIKPFITKTQKPATSENDYIKNASLRDHSSQLCFDLEINSEGLGEQARYGVFKDSENDLTIFWISISNSFHKGWVSLNAVKKDLNGITLSLYDKQANLLEKKLLADFNKKEKLAPVINNRQLFFNHDVLDHSCWTSFYEVYIRQDYKGIKKNDIVLDIGSNIGFFSAYALNKGASKVYSVEAVPQTFELLKRNLKNEKDIIFINKAISDKCCSKKIKITNGSSVASLNYSDNDNFNGHEVNSLSYLDVDCVDINSLVKTYNIDKIDFLKIDCEGSELEIFKTISEDYLKNNIDRIYCEVHDFYPREDYERFIKTKLMNCGFDVEGDEDINKNIFVIKAKKRKYKISHILNNPFSEREKASIESVSPLKFQGFDYDQFVFPLYTGIPPKDTCNRPDCVSEESGEYLLSSGHYGCYQAHKNAILESIKQNPDAILLIECDCILQLAPKEFSKKVNAAYDHCLKYDLTFVSFGKQIIDWQHNLVEEDFYITDKQSEAHCILIPKSKYEYIKEKLETCPWDVSDLWYNIFLSDYKRGIFGKPYALQHEGISEIDKKFKEGVRA